MENIQQHYDRIAPRRDDYIQKNAYYYKLLTGYYRYLIPEHCLILEIGSGTGHLLNALNPCFGVGIDISPAMTETAKKKFPHLTFYTGQAADMDLNETFDYIILSGTLGETDDIQALL